MSTNPQDFQTLLAQDVRSTAEKHSNTHRKPITNQLTADLDCISVGDPVEKVYHVHRTLLCARDPVFNAGYGPNSEFEERQKSELNLVKLPKSQISSSNGVTATLAIFPPSASVVKTSQ
jgi:hypothetical protein